MPPVASLRVCRAASAATRTTLARAPPNSWPYAFTTISQHTVFPSRARDSACRPSTARRTHARTHVQHLYSVFSVYPWSTKPPGHVTFAYTTRYNNIIRFTTVIQSPCRTPRSGSPESSALLSFVAGPPVRPSDEPTVPSRSTGVPFSSVSLASAELFPHSHSTAAVAAASV